MHTCTHIHTHTHTCTHTKIHTQRLNDGQVTASLIHFNLPIKPDVLTRRETDGTGLCVCVSVCVCVLKGLRGGGSDQQESNFSSQGVRGT